MRCFFATDLHGKVDRYRKLFDRVCSDHPQAVFLGGDLLAHTPGARRRDGQECEDFIGGFLAGELRALQARLEEDYPQFFMILGNDDPRTAESSMAAEAARGLWHYLHNRSLKWGEFDVYGYACVPPTPFRLKDWERYDVSRYVDPGCLPPEEGFCTVQISARERRLGTIRDDLDRLAGGADLRQAVFLFHTPPYQTHLDRAALDGMQVDHVPLDVHVGSVAVRRFIERRQPLLTLHGHVHESARLTGSWKDRIGRTHALSAAHDGPELALVVFSPADPERAVRELI